MRTILLAAFVISSISSWGQNTDDEFRKEIKYLKSQINSLRSENSKLNAKITTIERQSTIISGNVYTIQSGVDENTIQIKATKNALGSQIQESEKNSKVKIAALDDSISKKSLYWITAFFTISLFITILCFLLGKKIKSNKTQIEQQIAGTKKAMEEETVKLDTKLTELLEGKLRLIETEKTNGTPNLSEDVDHSLALKVADEIVRIKKNIFNMDPGTKGIKQLSASIKRIEDNFAGNGYEMPDLLNKQFDSRMKVIVANSIPVENLDNGEEIITKIIKPQVNYKGIMIQTAQVELSVGQ